MMIRNERGITLVEVVASIIILSIVLLSFVGLLVSTAKTTKTSETILDATYLVQHEMEKLYGIATKTAYTNRMTTITSPAMDTYTQISTSSGTTVFEKVVPNYPNYKYILTLKTYTFNSTIAEHPLQGNNSLHVTPVIIELIDTKKNVTKAKIETLLEWLP